MLGFGFGSWTSNLQDLKTRFRSAEPFPHVVIDGFFNEPTAETLLTEFPPLAKAPWIHYHNPIEEKFALNLFESEPIFKQLFEMLQSDETVRLIQSVTGIDELEADPTLHGAGLHCHPPGGKLDMHLDYSLHPILKKERRVNLIVYLNKEWSESYGGDIQLWDAAFTGVKQRVFPLFNRAVIFQTNDISYHGMPQMVRCPEGNSRKSVAIYYVSEPTEMKQVRYKAHFRPLPDQPLNDQLRKLFELRNHQSMTPALLAELYPDWERDPIGEGVWWLK